MYNEIDLDKIDINSQPPTEEPARQYYFMAKCRECVRVESERLGHPLTCAVITFGCQMNTEPETRETRINKGFYKTPTAKSGGRFLFAKFFEYIT